MDVDVAGGGDVAEAAAEAKLASFGNQLKAHTGLGSMEPAQRATAVRGMAQGAGVLPQSLLSSQ